MRITVVAEPGWRENDRRPSSEKCSAIAVARRIAAYEQSVGIRRGSNRFRLTVSLVELFFPW
jgi:hypothetical protein